VSTGAVDDLRHLAEVCREFGVWFHVDGAYGALAAVAPEAAGLFAGMEEADSLAVDPHKWLYAPLEAGCTLVRDVSKLRDTFSYHPAYYHFGVEATNYFDLGPQNSRSFRALKVWLALQQVGREGYAQMIGDDMRLSRAMFESTAKHPEIETMTQGLSIATFRYVPADLDRGDANVVQYLNELNQELLTRLQQDGEAYLSNAVIGAKYVLRACIVNFRTRREDVEAVAELVVRIGRQVDRERRVARMGKN
jgi:aromatic-L-amino-acid decarboxylase